MNKNEIKKYAVDLLKGLIRVPSFSKEEEKAADLIEMALADLGYKVERKYNNVWTCGVRKKDFPTILLNSHIDTVRPGSGWSNDPFIPKISQGKLYGLGSNDAGASVVALLAVFVLLGKMDLPYNLIYSATAEEEISGKNGVESILNDLGRIDMGIVGEPTGMNLAVAEKGLMVLDCVSSGKRSHAANNTGINAIYRATEDIDRIKRIKFPEKSKLLGEVTLQVTVISGGEAHNIIPETCSWVVDVRSNDCYTNREIFDLICRQLKSDIKSRSFRLNSSSIDPKHPIVKCAERMGIQCYGSGTLSDQALMPFPTVKIGPGDPMRSHTDDEFIMPREIYDGIDIYFNLLTNLKLK
jgi:acetylornithine deacetylase